MSDKNNKKSPWWKRIAVALGLFTATALPSGAQAQEIIVEDVNSNHTVTEQVNSQTPMNTVIVENDAVTQKPKGISAFLKNASSLFRHGKNISDAATQIAKGKGIENILRNGEKIASESEKANDIIVSQVLSKNQTVEKEKSSVDFQIIHNEALQKDLKNKRLFRCSQNSRR